MGQESNEPFRLDSIEKRAEAFAGNWQTFDSFAWHDKPEEPEQWAIVYTSNRDSRLTELSNETYIAKSLEAFLNPDNDDAPIDIHEERHNHWAVGYLDGYSIRVYRDEQITPVFRKWCEIQDRLDDYPLLDEEDYSRQEYEATLENLEQSAWRYDKDGWPEDWPGQLYSWFSENEESAIENRDDQGGYPSEEELENVIRALGWPKE